MWWCGAVGFVISDAKLFDRLRTVDQMVGSGGSLPVLSYFLVRLASKALSLATSSDRAALSASLRMGRDSNSKHFTISSGAVLRTLGRVPRRPLAFLMGARGLRVAMRCRGNGCDLVKRGTSRCPRTPTLNTGTMRMAVNTPIVLTNVGHSLFTATSSRLHPMVGNVCFSVAARSVAFMTSSKRGLMHGGAFITRNSRGTTFVLPGGPTALLGGLLPGRRKSIRVSFSSHGTAFALRGCDVVYHLVRKHCPGCGSMVPRSGPRGTAVSHVVLVDTLHHMSMFSSRTDDLVGLHLDRGRVRVSTRSVSFSASTRRALAYRCAKDPVDVNFGSAFLVSVLGGVSTRRVLFRLTSPSHTNIVIPMRRRRGRSLLVLLVPVVLGSWGQRTAV